MGPESRAFLLVAFAVCPGIASAHQPHDPVEVVAVSPAFSTDRTLFAISDSSFLDRSRDGGLTWMRMTSGLTTRAPYSAVALSPQYPSDGTVFVSTNGDGVFRSRDGGATWQNVSVGLGSPAVSRLAVSPSFGVDGTVLAAGMNGGLFKATGSDVTWRRVMDDGVRITALEFSPAFAGDRQVLAGDDAGRLYRSFDGGESWSLRIPSIGSTPLTSIALSPQYAMDGIIFLGFLGQGVYRSLDGGATFAAANVGLSDRRTTAIRLSPAFASDSTVFVCGAEEAVFRSLNSAGSWQKFDRGLYLRDQGVIHYRSLAVSDAFASDGIVFLGAFEGLFRSHDGGRRWFELEAAKPADTTSGLALAPQPGLGLWVSTYGGGIVHRPSPTADWTVQNRGLERPYVYDIAVSPAFADDATVFALQWDYVAKSTNGGAVWSLSRISPTGEVFPTSLALSPAFAADRTLLLGSRYTGLFRSTDGGATYANVLPEAGFVTSLAMSPGFGVDGTAFAGTATRGVYKTLDGGAAWTLAGTGIGLQVLALATSPVFDIDRTVLAGTSEGLFRTVDGGDSWSRVNLGSELQAVPVPEVAMSPDFGRDGLVLAAVRGAGLFRTLDHGETWSEVAPELVGSGYVLDRIRFSPFVASDNTVYGASGAALLRSTDRGQSWTAVPHPVRYESQNDLVRCQGNWTALRNELASSYDLVYSSRRGDYCLLTFVGTGVSWIGPRSPLQGIARVYVDGVLASRVDAFGPSQSGGEILFVADGLPRGAHVLRVEVTGERNSAATAANVVVDAFDVTR